jgi:hypothetical protein
VEQVMTMTRFEDRLISELIEEHGSALATVQRPASGRSSGRPLWIAGGVVAVAGVAAIGITLVGGGSSPAYAVTQNSDGTVTLTLNELSGIDGANQRLHQLGLPVTVVPLTTGCNAPVSAAPSAPSMPKLGTNDVTFSVRDIPAGDGLLVAVGSADSTPPVRNGTAVSLAEQLIRGPAPSCLPVVKIAPVPSGAPLPSGGSLPGVAVVPLGPGQPAGPGVSVEPSAPATLGGGN